LRCQTKSEPINPLKPEPQQRVLKIIDDIEEKFEDEEIREALLWKLERKWLKSKGHRVTIKFGKNIYDNPARCAICGDECGKEEGGYRIEILSRWNNTTSVIHLCSEHMDKNYWEADIDLLRHNYPKVGNI